MAGLRPHCSWLLLCPLVYLLLIGLNIYSGEWKALNEWVWADIMGEGLTTLLVLGWFFLVLSIRQAGRVTHLFAAGLIGLQVSLLQDVLDEFIRLPETTAWDSWIESMPVGLILLTIALYYWRHEQHYLNRLMQKRELNWRHPLQANPSVALNDVDYFRHRLSHLEKRQPQVWAASSVALLEIDDYPHWLHQYSVVEADALQQVVSELIVLAVRQQDLVCYFAGGRYLIFLNGINGLHARHLTRQVCQAIQGFGVCRNNSLHRTRLSLRYSLVDTANSRVDAVISHVEAALVACGSYVD